MDLFLPYSGGLSDSPVVQVISNVQPVLSALCQTSLHASFLFAMGLDAGEVQFTEPFHSAPFIMFVDNIGYLDVEERLLCLHFDIEPGPLVIVEREEYDDDMVLMRTTLQRPHTCIPRWSYRVRPGYYKILSLPSRLSSSEESMPTPQSVSSLNVSKSEKGLSRLSTIEESPEINVHCLSSDSDSDCEVSSDSEDVIVVGSADDFCSASVGAQDAGIRYPKFQRNVDVRSDGIVKSEDESGNSFNPSQGSGNQKTVLASEWLASSHGIAPTIAESDHVASETLP